MKKSILILLVFVVSNVLAQVVNVDYVSYKSYTPVVKPKVKVQSTHTGSDILDGLIRMKKNSANNVVAGIHKNAFTVTIKEQCDSAKIPMNSIQFRTSEKIILYKNKHDATGMTNKNGNLHEKVKNDYETIVIIRNTPCTVDRVLSDGTLIVRFEQKSGAVLAFTPNSLGEYSLGASNWTNTIGKLRYDNKEFDSDNGTTVLKVKMRKLNMINGRGHVAKGSKINK